ncbi:TPR-like protein [Nadsonia fulvescens var. elongata DSM 6958]|uniref:TPR-like protein n=1 Tax=Nadsonia fulvescens var. elongata DSM 6958 TaxID=857566 RepID=A0A1E3PRZ1_9ASCO|nr:TPR-like protein [Nadsonia fulvescens var. elongata DSM 6958]
MSFMNGGGGECSTGANPLAQFTKHSAIDRSLQHERFQGGSPSSMMSMRSTPTEMSQHDREAMDSFLNGGQPQQANLGAFVFENMHQELSHINSHERETYMEQHTPSHSTEWVDDFHGGSGGEVANWDQEFNRKVSTPPLSTMNRNSPGSNMIMSRPGGFGGSRFMPSVRPTYAGGMMNNSGPHMAMHTGPLMSSSTATHANVTEDHWQNQFSQFEGVDIVSDKGKGKVSEVETATQDQDQGLKLQDEEEIQDLSDPTLDLEDDYKDHFDQVWSNMKGQLLDNIDGWKDHDEVPTWENTIAKPVVGDYEFDDTENIYMDKPDAFTIGCQLMDSGAKLSEAVLAFEAAVQQNPEHVEAWSRLGAAQSQNEKEELAMRALEKCLTLDPGNLAALLNLSVSYTNEGYENAAYSQLEKWISTKYPHIVEQAEQENKARMDIHERVTDLFIQAALLSPEVANMDADVQIGLGVLFYGSSDYDKAIDCFNAALSVRPDDPLLWNRLGATLANSQRSEEAISAYYKALDLRPSFVRARYNLGVSCVNIGCYQEAVQHLLGALSMYRVDGLQDDNDFQNGNLYVTLKRVFMAMDRPDLVEKVNSGADVEAYRNEFDF